MRIGGFTLIELMITLAIIGVMTSIAYPSWNPMIQWIRISAASSQLERSIRLARRTAILKNSKVTICPSADGEWCSEGSDWSTGWLIYLDYSGTASRQAQDPIVRSLGGYSGIQIHYNRGVRLGFNNLGRIVQNGSLVICDPLHQANSVRIVMIHSGRLRLERRINKDLCN